MAKRAASMDFDTLASAPVALKTNKIAIVQTQELPWDGSDDPAIPNEVDDEVDEVEGPTTTNPVTPKSTNIRTVVPTGGFKIEKGIAIPDGRGGGGKSKYPWADLDKDDTFFVPDAKVSTFHTLCSTSSKKFGVKFVSRKWEEKGVTGVRVWRTE